MRTWVVVAALLGTTSAWAGEPDLRGGFTAGAEVKLPKTAKKQLKQGLKLLDKGEVVPFLERFVHPKDREGMPDLAVVAENVKAVPEAGSPADPKRAQVPAALVFERSWEYLSRLGYMLEPS